MMAHELAFAALRQGDLTAAEAWKLVSPIVTTDDKRIATQLSDALRTWTWKALDRRRRDAALREWVDLLNRVETFLAERFATVAARIDVLVELLHESLAVADATDPDTLLRRKHVKSILTVLRRHEGEWLDRAALMDELGLKPANTTRLMACLVDAGWAEQEINGREAAYRLSAEGLVRAQGLDEPAPVCRPAGVWAVEYKRGFIAKVFTAYGEGHGRHQVSDPRSGSAVLPERKHEWDGLGLEIAELIEIEPHEDEQYDENIRFQPALMRVTG